MKSPANVTFDALPDMALIQIRALVNYKVVPYSATTIWRKCRAGEFPSLSKYQQASLHLGLEISESTWFQLQTRPRVLQHESGAKHTLEISILKVTKKELNKEFQTC